MNSEKTILVTGGGGFLGKNICFQLKDRGYKVVSLSRKKYPELEAKGIESRLCDIAQHKETIKALKGADAVIHTAARAGIWGKPEDFYKNNTIGTENILEACTQNKINYLVYTSSPSICFSGKDIKGEDEKIPYANPPLCAYSQSKKQAEKLVLKKTNNSLLKASCLRPHLIWGPNDPHFLPRLREKACSSKLFKVGKGENLVDIVYVDNAARAHIELLENLFLSDKTRGQVYFIGQESPVNLWNFLNKLLEASKLPPVKRKISFTLAYALGALSESFYKAFKIYYKEPRMTPFLALQLSKSHYFDHSKAKKDFAYKAHISTEEGLKLLRRSLNP